MTATIIEFSGEFDITQSGCLDEALSIAVENDRVILIFSDVAYMDSAFLNALAMFRRRRHEDGNDANPVIVGARPPIARLFAITKLDKLFDLRQEASYGPECLRLTVRGGRPLY
ncbi:MAG TPA: STAS domain-containing protein [Candidatus Baltobacteraceae bacterium]|jgi:anti-anti-sigma factor|nr:STAS domain-containing protein [Candidatus Baltobacteraceae bacterium]